MKAAAFNRLISQIDDLTPSQRDRLFSQLNDGDGSVIELLIENHQTACPHCNSDALRPWGSSHGLPRYRCKNCNRTSNPLTGTPLARLRHKECWLQFAECLIRGFSVRDSAKECGVAKNTAFLWRHRFLTLIAERKARRECGIVEVDETYFLESFKGQRKLLRPPRKRGGVSKKRGAGSEDQVPVLVVRDRAGKTADFILDKADFKHVYAELKPLIASDACLCTDGAAVYKKFADKEGIEHQVIKPKESHSRGPYHIQNVNAYDSRLKTWLVRFRGVATKYLDHYLGWFRMLDRYGSQLEPKLCLREAVGWVQQLI